MVRGPVPRSPRPPARARRAPRSSSPARQLKAGRIRRVAVVCPTTPLTRQWAAAAARMGAAPRARRRRPAPARATSHGVAVTYARVAASAARWATQCTPGTLVIADEAHHLGEELAWGEGFHLRLRPGAAPPAAVGHAVPLRPVPDPRRALRRRRRDARRVLQLRRRGPRPHLPAGHVHPLRRRAAVAQRRGARRGVLRGRARRPRGGPPLPHGDLDRPRRRPAADPRRRPTRAWRRRAPRGTRTPAASSSPPTPSTPARSPRSCARSPASPRRSCCTPTRRPRGACRSSRAPPTAGSSR